MTMHAKSKHARKESRRKLAGTRRNRLATQSPVPFDSDKLKQLYSTMLRCRMAAERARLLAKQGKLQGDLGATGHEAAEVGALIELLADDCIAPGRRELAAFLIRGAPLKAIFARLSAHQPGSADLGLPQVQPMIVPALSLSAQLNLVTGAAWSLERQGKPGVAVAFSGDDSASLGFWRDAVVFSVAHKLPIVHIVHNNAGDGSVSARFSLPAEDSADARYSGLPAFTVDGNDVVAVYRVAQEAIRRARQGHGPALIECQSYRLCSQLETDSNNRRRAAVELDQSADPIARMETYLKQKGLWSDKWKRKLVERFGRELDRAQQFAERSAPPTLGIINPPLATAS